MTGKKKTLGETFSATLESEVCTHMNSDHADAVLLYARHFAGHPGATQARMTAIDPQGIVLSIFDTHWMECRVDFAEPLGGERAIRPTLIKMARQARDADQPDAS